MTSGDIDGINWLFEPPVRDFSGSVYIEDQKVTAITLWTVDSLTLIDAFDRLGQPEQVWTEIAPGTNNESLEVYFLYPEKGFLIETEFDLKEGMQQVEIKKNMRVYRVSFFNPERYQELLDTRILIRRPPPIRKNSPEPWQGFGALQIERD